MVDVPLRGLAAHGDGARALVWIDRKLRLLDLMRGLVLETADPGLDVEGWAWTPDGKAVVVVGGDPSTDGHGAVAFLDPNTLSTKSRTGFAPGTSDVLIASVDGALSLWDPRPEAAVKAACQIAGRDLTAQEWSTYLPNREREKVCGS